MKVKIGSLSVIFYLKSQFFLLKPELNTKMGLGVYYIIYKSLFVNVTRIKVKLSPRPIFMFYSGQFLGLIDTETNFCVSFQSVTRPVFTGFMSAEGMCYVLAFREAKMFQKLRPFANSCNRIGKCTESVTIADQVCQKLRKNA